jgi:beta-lactamase class D
MRLFLLVAAAPLLVGSQRTPPLPDVSAHFAGLNGTFVLLNGSTGEYVRYNRSRAAERFAPCSTFKIPHTAILLESGAAPDPTFTLKYDPALKQPSNWAQDFDLSGAFKASALWYYQTMARRLRMPAEHQFVQRFQYGNSDTSGGIDETGNPSAVLRGPAWLIRTHDAVTKEIMVAQNTARWRLSAKTGACQPQGQETSNWYVGYVEKAGTVYYFALQMGATDYGRAYSERIPITRAILTELGILN